MGAQCVWGLYCIHWSAIYAEAPYRPHPSYTSHPITGTVPYANQGAPPTLDVLVKEYQNCDRVQRITHSSETYSAEGMHKTQVR